MADKNKEYLQNDTPLSKYAKTKIRKLIHTDKVLEQEGERETSDVDELNDNLQHDVASYIDDNYSEPDVTISEYNITYDVEIENMLTSAMDCDDNNLGDDVGEYSSDDEILKIFEKHATKSKCSKEFTEDELLADKFLNIQVKPAELLLTCLKYTLSNRLSILGLTNLLKYTNNICDINVVPESRYYIDKLISKSNKVTLHGVCPLCSTYLGTFETLGKSINCLECKTEVDVSNPSSPCFFAWIDPSNAIKDYLETHDKFYDFVVSERKHEKNHIKDIYDGKLYRQFVKSLKEEEKHCYAAALFNTDGAAVFKSSKYSVWPVYIILNEIPVQFRLKSSIVCGPYFGIEKPAMGVFLQVFVNNMNRLSVVGVPCIINGVQRNVKVYPLLACVDTIARAPMNGSSQFNAKYGCD